MISPKQRLLRGEKLTGAFCSMFSAIATEIVAAAGYDTVLIDLEHGPGDLLAAIGMMQAAESRGAAPLLRVPSSDKVEIKRALDAGPMGIMIPDIRSGDHAAQVVQHCRYAPSGDRGAAPGYMRATDYSGAESRARNGKPYQTYMREDFLLMLQVESAEGLEQVDAIAAVDGVDMIFIGPADLSASLGELGDFDSTKFVQAMTRIESATLDAGKLLGCIPFGPWSAEKLYGTGHSLVITAADGIMLAKSSRLDAAAAREAAGGG